jgi:hypothetical protein
MRYCNYNTPAIKCKSTPGRLLEKKCVSLEKRQTLQETRKFLLNASLFYDKLTVHFVENDYGLLHNWVLWKGVDDDGRERLA